MINWWDTVKENKLVNLPKFKVKPFNTAKPNEEETRCKDKIIEIANFTKNFELPIEIAGEFVRVKGRQAGPDFMTMHYYGEATKAKLIIHRYAKMEVDDIPEEVFCKVLDMLNNNLKSVSAVVMDYSIDVGRRDDKSFYGQSIIIYHGGRIKVNLNLSIVWYDWFNYEDGKYDENPPLSSEEEFNIAQALRTVADNMRWPI